MEMLVNSLIIAAVAAVALVLLTGLVGFIRGGDFYARNGNKLMRWRVGIQAVALVLLALGALLKSLTGV